MERIGDALCRSADGLPCSSPIVTPRPVAGLVTRRVLVMDYLSGEPLSPISPPYLPHISRISPLYHGLPVARTPLALTLALILTLTLTLALILTLQARHAAAGPRQQPRRRTARATGHRAARLRPERLPLDGPAQGRQLLRHDPRHVRRQPRQPVQARRVLGVARVCLLMGRPAVSQEQEAARRTEQRAPSRR